MACELFLLSSLWFLFVIFWMETISIWLFLCNFYQDRAFYPWGERVFVTDPSHMLHVFISDGPGRSQISPCSQRSGWGRGARPPLRGGPGAPGQQERSASWRTLGLQPAQCWKVGGTCCPSGLRTQSGSQESNVVNQCDQLAE